MKICGSIGEFCASFFTSYHAQRAKQKLRSPTDVDFALKSAGNDALKGLKECEPLSDHLSRAGAEQLGKSLKRKDYLGSMLAIDSNTLPSKKEVCIVLLKIAVNAICNGYCVDDIAAATFTMIASNY